MLTLRSVACGFVTLVILHVSAPMAHAQG